MKRTLGLALFAALILPGSIAGRIVPYACIDGIGLWDRSPRVLEEWGKPNRTTQRTNYVTWEYERGEVTFDRWQEPLVGTLIVAGVRTSDPGQQLPNGIGVGSSITRVRRVYPDMTCSYKLCDIGGVRRGAFTSLAFKRGRVSEVDISAESHPIDGQPPSPDPRCRRS